ncbi:MAG TPA: hypothetical protein VKA08_02960 [Balneolales bacterium]|nr:hypothetical protein [Balneolales bacterium]
MRETIISPATSGAGCHEILLSPGKPGKIRMTALREATAKPVRASSPRPQA